MTNLTDLDVTTLTVSGSSANVAALTGVTAGTVTASKALVVDANKDLSVLRNLGIAGTLTCSGGNGVNIVAVPDNLAAAWSLKEGSTNYIVIVTTDSNERVSFGVDLAYGEGVDVNVGTTTGTKLPALSTQKLGLFGVTPVTQPAALTAQLTSITHTEPGTPDYAIQNLTSSSPFGFVTADEGNSVLKVILNLQTRMAELENRLETLGAIAAN